MSTDALKSLSNIFQTQERDEKAAATTSASPEQLAHHFSSEFLEEVRFFNQVGKKAERARS
ncbi:MAG: hypothetical protein S4CHLAM81_14980 [Chlamydiales bacterium]|nr:hypothetical protein [Chlamydiales bacterium]MCH9636267.1 hypothetical protein [Chlamydiales bacterium]